MDIKIKVGTVWYEMKQYGKRWDSMIKDGTIDKRWNIMIRDGTVW